MGEEVKKEVAHISAHVKKVAAKWIRLRKHCERQDLLVKTNSRVARMEVAFQEHAMGIQ